MSEASCANWRVLLVDDSSKDATVAVAKATVADLDVPPGRFVLLEAGPRPRGQRWVGKNWACSQAMTQVDSDWVLFVNADVRLHPPTLRRALDQAQAEQADLLSLAPQAGLQLPGRVDGAADHGQPAGAGLSDCCAINSCALDRQPVQSAVADPQFDYELDWKGWTFSKTVHTNDNLVTPARRFQNSPTASGWDRREMRRNRLSVEKRSGMLGATTARQPIKELQWPSSDGVPCSSRCRVQPSRCRRSSIPPAGALSGTKPPGCIQGI